MNKSQLIKSILNILIIFSNNLLANIMIENRTDDYIYFILSNPRHAHTLDIASKPWDWYGLEPHSKINPQIRNRFDTFEAQKVTRNPKSPNGWTLTGKKYVALRYPFKIAQIIIDEPNITDKKLYGEEAPYKVYIRPSQEVIEGKELKSEEPHRHRPRHAKVD